MPAVTRWCMESAVTSAPAKWTLPLVFAACDTGFAPVHSLIEHALSLAAARMRWKSPSIRRSPLRIQPASARVQSSSKEKT